MGIKVKLDHINKHYTWCCDRDHNPVCSSHGCGLLYYSVYYKKNHTDICQDHSFASSLAVGHMVTGSFWCNSSCSSKYDADWSDHPFL